jgi:protein involved in polysaccharide export with SLBB domain
MKPRIMHLFKPSAFKCSLLLLPLLALWLAGCQTNDNKGAMEGPSNDGTGLAAARLHVGDDITVAVEGPPPPDVYTPHEEVINDDGTINLLYIGRVKAAGKTPGELEAEIHDLYVPAYYTHATVTIKVGDRVFYVRGEIKTPGRQIYVGEITVTKAITSAGDFTDFASRKDVVLIRADGRRFTLNCDKILAGKIPDPPVFPGDQIEVDRRNF